MNKICKEYISDARKFFPIMGKKEREYLRKASCDIEDFIEAEKITTKSKLVEKYHQPYEVANNYYATFFDTELIIKRIKISKYIKLLITIIIAAIIIVGTIRVIDFIQLNQSYSKEEMVSNSDSLVDNETYGDIEKNEGGGFIEEEIIE